jgi:hypothetical protein
VLQLGFAEQAQLALEKHWRPSASGPLGPQETPEFLRRFVNQIPQSGARRFSLVIIDDYGTRADAWLPWNEMPCLAYRLTSLSDLNEDLRRLGPWLPAAFVFFAFPGVPNAHQSGQALDVFRRLQMRGDYFTEANAILMGEYPIARETPLPLYYLETPPSLEEAVRHLDSLPAEALRVRDVQHENQS